MKAQNILGFHRLVHFFPKFLKNYPGSPLKIQITTILPSRFFFPPRDFDSVALDRTKIFIPQSDSDD